MTPAAPLAGSRTLRILGIGAAAAVAIFAARELAWLLSAVFLALLIVTLTYPVYAALRARRVPALAALGGFLLVVYGSIVVLFALVVYALARFASLLPEYAQDLHGLTAQLAARLTDAGLAAPQIRELLEGVDVLAAVRWVTGQIPSLLGLLSLLVLIGTLLIFVTVEATQLPLRTRALRQDHPHIADALALTAARTRRFFAVTTIFAVVVGALNTILLLILDIPLAPLWGLLAAVCNYVPYLGFWVGMTPPALLALAGGGWDTFLVVVGAYLVLNFVVTSLIPAKIIGDTVGMSMVVEVIAIVFWAWVLGPLGAILAIPLTITAKALFVDSNPNATWLGGFLDSGKSLRAAATSRT